MLRTVCGLLKMPAASGMVSKRFYRRKILTWPVDYLPFSWSYPPKQNLIQDSGDKVNSIAIPDADQPIGAFAKLPEMAEAPASIQKIFSVGFAPRAEQHKHMKEDFLNLIKRHPLDDSSLEYKIAYHTYMIRKLKPVYRESHSIRNKKLKHILHNRVQLRNKYLNQLLRQDKERYNFVKAKLQIEHTPFPLGQGHQPFTRKGELRRLTAEWAENLKKEKLEAYHEELKLKQADFEKEKRETLDFIAKEIQALQLTEDEQKELEIDGILKYYSNK